MAEPRAQLSRRQVEQLLKPVHPGRVVKADAKARTHDHLSQQDVTAHLIRIFGFGGFDTEVLAVECLFEHNRLTSDGKVSQRWDVGYRALVRLTIRNEFGELVARYENGATAAGQNLDLAGAHDLAYKSAISVAMKRCAINLGDQFGLSLYNKGQKTALVIDTMVKPHDPAEPEQIDAAANASPQTDSDELELGQENGSALASALERQDAS